MPRVLRGKEAHKKVSQLRKLSTDASGWEILYIDDATDERWKLDYPEGEQHGGGSPRLTKLD